MKDYLWIISQKKEQILNSNGTLYEKGYYERNGIFSEFKYLLYVGEFKNNKYNGKGKLYMDHYLGKYLYYEGNFDNNIFTGNGKMFYQNKNYFMKVNLKIIK